jgi:hypothetical protein
MTCPNAVRGLVPRNGEWPAASRDAILGREVPA